MMGRPSSNTLTFASKKNHEVHHIRWYVHLQNWSISRRRFQQEYLALNSPYLSFY